MMAIKRFALSLAHDKDSKWYFYQQHFENSFFPKNNALLTLIYLAARSLSCDTQDHLAAVCELLVAVCGI